VGIVLIHDWWNKSDMRVIYHKLHDAVDLYRMYMLDHYTYFVPYYRYFFKKIKGTKQLLVKIKNYPEPDALISAINYMQVFESEDPIFVVDNKKKANLDSDGEVIKFENLVKNKNQVKI